MTAGSKYPNNALNIPPGGLPQRHHHLQPGLLPTPVKTTTKPTPLISGISQDFGDLTTVTMGYTRGDDTVMMNGDESDGTI